MRRGPQRAPQAQLAVERDPAPLFLQNTRGLPGASLVSSATQCDISGSSQGSLSYVLCGGPSCLWESLYGQKGF